MGNFLSKCVFASWETLVSLKGSNKTLRSVEPSPIPTTTVAAVDDSTTTNTTTATTPTMETTEPASLMSLPVELRLQIYEKLQLSRLLDSPPCGCHHIGCESEPPRKCACRHRPCPERKQIRTATISLLTVSKEIHAECFDEFFRSFTYHFQIDDGPFYIKTPDITKMMAVNGSDEWTIGADQVRNMRKWTVTISLGGRPAKGFGPRDRQGYLTDEYNNGARDRRKKASMSSIANIRTWLQKWSFRLTDSGTELDKLEVLVQGADLIALREGNVEKELHEMDLLAPLRNLTVRKGGHASIKIQGEAYDTMEEGSRGFEVKKNNDEYADMVVKAMHNKVKENAEAISRRELRCFAKSIRDVAARVPGINRGRIAHIDRGAAEAKRAAQTQLERIDASTAPGEMVESLAYASTLIEQNLGDFRRMIERIIGRRIKRRDARAMLIEVDEVTEKVRSMKEWLHVRHEVRLLWPGELPNPFLDWKTAPRIEERSEPWDFETMTTGLS
ncbi:MAG: hypothetical protein Q9193_000979 [Seirophora villosa]